MPPQQLADNPDCDFFTASDEDARVFLAQHSLLDPLLRHFEHLRETRADGPVTAGIASAGETTHFIVGLADSETGEKDSAYVIALAFPMLAWTVERLTAYVERIDGLHLVWRQC